MLGIGHGPTTQVVVVGFAGLIVFCLWAHAISRRAALAPLAVVAVVAGIVGNLVDRVFLGSVPTDFLVIPGDVAINLADVAVAVGLMVCVASAALFQSRSHSATTTREVKQHEPHPQHHHHRRADHRTAGRDPCQPRRQTHTAVIPVSPEQHQTPIEGGEKHEPHPQHHHHRRAAPSHRWP